MYKDEFLQERGTYPSYIYIQLRKNYDSKCHEAERASIHQKKSLLGSGTEQAARVCLFSYKVTIKIVAYLQIFVKSSPILSLNVHIQLSTKQVRLVSPCLSMASQMF